MSTLAVIDLVNHVSDAIEPGIQHSSRGWVDVLRRQRLRHGAVWLGLPSHTRSHVRRNADRAEHFQSASIAWTQKEIQLSMTAGSRLRGDARRIQNRPVMGRVPRRARTEAMHTQQYSWRRIANRRVLENSERLVEMVVELIGIEPTTSGLQSPRSPN